MIEVHPRYPDRRWWQFWRKPRVLIRNCRIELGESGLYFDVELAGRSNRIEDCVFVMDRADYLTGETE